jgi:hypothetical protein
MRTFLRNNGLSATFILLFVGSLFAGREATFENRESEFLRVFVWVLLTAFLIRKGSAKSTRVAAPHARTGGSDMRIVFLLALLALSGCRMREDPALRVQVRDLAQQMDSLREAMALRAEEDSVRPDPEVALLSPGDPSPAFVLTRAGFLAVRIDSFQNDAGGCRVTFHFGNPHNATLKGVSAQLEWITLGGDGPGTLETRAPIRYQFMHDLKPGSITRMPVLLLETPPARMRGVRLSRVDFQEIAFAKMEGPRGGKR